MSENRLKVGDLIKVGNKVFIARIAGAAISTALLILILLSACTPAPTTAPTLTATITLQPPTATNIPPTPTVTPVPTQSPEQVADALGLRSEPYYRDRTFAYREISGETYLVDEHNGAPKAVLENGTWRRLDYADAGDAELMYGHLVPENGEYIHPEMYHTKTGLYGRDIDMSLLGDWEVRPIDYEGQQINIYYLLAGLRDGDGKIHIVRLAYDSPDIMEHWAYYMCSYDSRPGPASGQAIYFPLEESLTHLRVGETGYLVAYEYSEYEQEKEWASPEYPQIINNAKGRLMIYLYNEYPDEFRLTDGERADLELLKWPDRTVTLATPGGVAVKRDSEEDCGAR